MSAGDDDEVYSDVPSNAPVSDMRLKIAMFNKPTGTTPPPATKPKLSAQPSRPANTVGPKPPMNLALPPKKQLGQHKPPPTRACPPSADTNGKPAPTVPPLSPKNSTSEGASASEGGGLPSPVRQSIFHLADRELKTTVTKSHHQPSTTLKGVGQNHTLYPRGKVKTDHGTPPTLPTRTPGMNLVRGAGQTYRKLPFVVGKGPAPGKPPKPPADQTTKVGGKMADVEEFYEDASSYRNEAEEYVEEEYEEVGAFAEAFRRQQEVTNYDDELYDDINVTT